MRIAYASTTHCSHIAKALKRELAPIKTDLTLSTCQNAVARMMGYRNWQELAAHARPGVVESPSDDQLDSGEAALRATRQASVLSDVMGIASSLATDIVARIRPSARRAALVASEALNWRTHVEAMMAAPGLAGYGPDDMERLMNRIEGSRPIHVRPWKAKHVDGQGELRVSISNSDARGGVFRFDEVDMAQVVDGRVVARACGYVIIPCAEIREAFSGAMEDDIRDGALEEFTGELCELADDVEDDLVEAAFELVKTGDAIRLLARGSVFVLTHVTRDHSSTTKGDGARFLAAVIKVWNTRKKGARIHSIAVEPRPAGFDGMAYNERRVSKAWQAARDHLSRRLTASSVLLTALGDGARIVTYDSGPASEVAERIQAEAEAMQSRPA